MDEYMEPTEEEIQREMGKTEYMQEEQEKQPKVLFKYRAIVNAVDLVRVLDILNNNRLYFPKVCELNDPFEGGNVDCLSEEDNIKLMEKKNTYRLLSLSADCFTPTLWAYYAHDASGVCIGFHRQNNFYRAEQVEYKKTVDKQQWISFEPSDALSIEYVYKNLVWSHEKEYRIGHKEGEEFFEFEEYEFACLILGNNIDTEIENLIIETAKTKDIRIFKLNVDWKRSRYFLTLLGNEEKRIYEIVELLEALEYCEPE